MTDQITKKPTCPNCGAEVPPDAPRGYCLNCLFRLGTTEPKTVSTESSSQIANFDSQPNLARSFGDYELLEEIARGGMGIIYKARQKSLGRIVAVKMLLFGDQSGKEQAQRFRAEAAAAASLQHPNIVAIHEVSAHEGQPFFVMDFIEGLNLAKLSAQCEVRNTEWLRRASRYVQRVAEAIHYAHERGILHRDLKPSNILIDPFDQPRVTDFGLAKSLHHDSELTLSGQVLGSPNYMPPEQAAAKRGLVGRRSDVYSLGAILYHLLTGHPPMLGETLTDTLHNVVNQEPVSPRLLNPAVPRDLETLCLKCLQKEPAQRYQTAQALGVDLDSFLRSEPIRARRIGYVAKSWRWCRRKPALASLGAGILLLLIAVAIGSPIAIYLIDRERKRAEKGELAARASESVVRHKAYASDMNRVQSALELGNLGNALSLLNRYRPSPTGYVSANLAQSSHGLADRVKEPVQSDLRGWEWRYLWKQCRSDALFVLCQQSNLITSLTASSDGKWLAVGTFYRGVSVVDLATRREIVHFPASEAEDRAAFSPRESLLAVSTVSEVSPTNFQYSICLWDGATRQIATNLSIGGFCLELAFSDDGQTLIASTREPDNFVTLWRCADAKRLARFPAQGQIAFAASHDLKIAAYANGEDGDRVEVLDLSSGAKRLSYKAADEHILSLAISPDGKILASGPGFAESTIRLWDVATGKEIGRLEGHHAGVQHMVFWPDGKTLASCSVDQTIRLWDVTDPAHGKALSTLQGHQSDVVRLALLPDKRRLISGSKDGAVYVWDTAVLRRGHDPATLPTKLADWRFAPDGSSVVTVDARGSIAQWQGIDFKERRPLLEIGITNFDQVCISDDTRWMACGSCDGEIEVWDLHKCNRIGEFKAHPGRIILYQFLARGTKLMIAHRDDNSLHEWDLRTWQETRSWRGVPGRSTCAFSPDEERWLTLHERGASSLLDLTTGRETSLNIGWYANASFSPDGRFFAAASFGGYARLWETATRREVTSFTGFLSSVHSVAFSPDGQRLATGSGGEQAIKLWDLESYLELLTLKGKGSEFGSSAFSPDGNVLGSMNDHGLLHLWRAPSWAEIEAAEAAEIKRK